VIWPGRHLLPLNRNAGACFRRGDHAEQQNSKDERRGAREPFSPAAMEVDLCTHRSLSVVELPYTDTRPPSTGRSMPEMKLLSFEELLAQAVGSLLGKLCGNARKL
jgi:hypothetical protein